MAAADATQHITDTLNSITGSDQTTQLILNIANSIQFSWFEWVFKVALVAIIFLFFKDLVYSVFRYILIRIDKSVGIGTMVEFQGKIGRISTYGLKYITLETLTGEFRVPLDLWLSNTWTQIQDISSEFNIQREQNKYLELKLTQIETDFKKLKDQYNNDKLEKITKP